LNSARPFGLKVRREYAVLRTVGGVILISAGACALPAPRASESPHPETIVGCYKLSYHWDKEAQAWPEFESLQPPSHLRLSSSWDDPPAETEAEESYRDIGPLGPDNTYPMSGWRFSEPGVLEIISSDGFVGFTMNLRRHFDYFVGEVTLFSDYGYDARAKVRARKMLCRR
jgi:hypothetical protein